MFDILVYLFENYYTPQACPAADVLASGSPQPASSMKTSTTPSAGRPPAGTIYEPAARLRIHRLHRLPGIGRLPAPLREIVIDRGLASPETPVPLDKIKIIALMVLWSQEAEIDNLVLEELLDDEACGACTDRGRAAGRPPFCPFFPQRGALSFALS